MRTSLPHCSILRGIAGALVLGTLLLAPVRAEEADLSISIKCSPSAVVLHAVRSGDWMTVHTDIPYRLVDPKTVTLVAPGGELDAAATFADDRGNLVAKFKMTELIKLLETDEATNDLTLTGVTAANDTFAGTDTVRIVKK